MPRCWNRLRAGTWQSCSVLDVPVLARPYPRWYRLALEGPTE